jgi:hypothetical protein
MGSLAMFLVLLGKKKPCKKNQGWPIKSTKQMRTQVDTTQRKTTKENNQQKLGKDPIYINRYHGYEMIINNNKKDLRQNNCHLPQINYDVWKRSKTPTKCSNSLKNHYGLCMLQGYGHTCR